MRDPYRRTPQQSQSFDPTPLLLCNDISHCQMARRHVCAVALVPLGLTQPDTDRELVRCCLARMQHHRSVSVQTDSRHCHGFPPLGLTRTALPCTCMDLRTQADILQAERRYRIVVSTPRCGRINPSLRIRVPTHTKIKRELDWLFAFVCVLGDQSLGGHQNQARA